MPQHQNEFYIRGEDPSGMPYAFTKDCRWVLAAACGDKTSWAKFPSYDSADYVRSTLPVSTTQRFASVKVGLV